ncbi:UNVERIFIED_CONTAM: hypothetical protein GTU68_029286 [Idotea baltica]|nr:hypothetical protein [Idotea baltica]
MTSLLMRMGRIFLVLIRAGPCVYPSQKPKRLTATLQCVATWFR